MRKAQELADAGSCLNKAKPDEPVFVLRAKDPLAPQTVRLWAAMAFSVHEPEKRVEAEALADEMDKWRNDNVAMPAPRTSTTATTAALGWNGSSS